MHPALRIHRRRVSRAASPRRFPVLGLLVTVVSATPMWLRSDAKLASLFSASDPPLAHEWQLVEGKHWQIVSPSVEDMAVTDASEGTRGACAPGMVEIKGRMKVSGNQEAIEWLQNVACVDWIDREFPERCARFDREHWLALSRSLESEPMHYCIDRFEYPDRRGDYPWILVSWHEARELCSRTGKRLCSETEWTFACEGEEALPYPYGYVRDPNACIIDRPWRPVDEHALAPRDGPHALAEIDRLWHGEASGARSRCRSPFGVYDMTGNVDEWTTSVRAGERPSILKGGYWGPVRTRCRPSTRAHDEEFVFYQQGFRCYAEAAAPPASSDSAPHGE